MLSIKSPEEMADDAEQAVEAGYRKLKIKVGEDPESDIERVRAIHGRVPDVIGLKADANQGWDDAKTALTAVSEISEWIDVIEQPVAADAIGDLRELRRRVDIPVMPDESVRSPADVIDLVGREAGDVYNIKLMKTGGISEAIRLDAIAEADGRPTQIGSMVEGHVGTAAGVHFALARENASTSLLSKKTARQSPNDSSKNTAL